MRYLKKIIKKLYRILLILKAKSTISHLTNEPDTVLKSLGNAFAGAIANKATQEEKKWVMKIESLRKKLKSSLTEIMITDYGASATQNLTDAEMKQGRIIYKTIGEICRNDSQPYFWSFLLFKLIREFKPYVCLELGTCLGFSASYQAAALKLNKTGKIVTLEGSEALASVSKQNFQTVGLDNINVVTGRFQDTLDTVLKEYKFIEFVFIDGHHDEKATLAYFKQILPFLSEKSIVIFDDIAWSNGMKKAWNTIVKNEKIRISIDLSTIGICIIDNGVERKHSFKIPMI